MMKKKLLALIMSFICAAAAVPGLPVYADGQKVVTLGADLSAEQKEAILRYFGIYGQNIQTLTITNQDERDHLGSYVPLEQIGSRTYSCALVNPTTSGGIQVKTANLSWVTSNMIATTLSTSGVVNCEVLAAAPFEVSGTGALTGILMAYESAVGTTLDTTKKEVATQELITTTTIANTIGQIQATDIVNESKKQIIQGNVVNNDDIYIVIDDVAEEEGIALTDEDRQLLVDLMQQIADQDYEYEDVQETLERVEQNMDQFELEEDDEYEEDYEDEEYYDDSEDTAAPPTDGMVDIAILGDASDSSDAVETQETLAADSILMNTDDSALGAEVLFDATDHAALEITGGENQTQFTEEVSQTPADILVIEDSLSDSEIVWDDTATVVPTTPAESPIEDLPAQDDTIEIPEASDAAVIPDDSGEMMVIPDESGGTEVIPDGIVTTDAVPDAGAENAEPVTLNLEVIPTEAMKFAPITSEANGYQVHQAGITELIVDIARADIIGGTGTLTLYQAADSSTVETIAMNEPDRILVQPLDAEKLAEYGWTAGSRAVIPLTEPLAPLTAYYVMLSDDAFQTADGIGTSAATADSYSWTLNTGEYGFYIDKTAEGITAGSPVQGNLSMESELAVYACIENADPAMVTFDMTEFYSSGTFTATFAQPGTTVFQVSFYDEAGTCLYTTEYSVTVK